MSKVRPPYLAALRLQMVELVQTGRSPSERSREFGVTAQSMINSLTTADREELVRLRKQLRQVPMECDILAKATAWFAGRSDATSNQSSDS